MAAPTVVGTAVGSRVGAGSVSVTAPGSSTAWLAVVLDNADVPSVAPATNFSSAGSLGSFAFLYLCTGSPGSSWGINGTGTGQGGVVIVIGYDSGITVGTPSTTSGAVSPTVTAADACLVMRGINGARSNDVAPGYPASHTLGQAYDNQDMSGYFLMVAVAHASVAAGATGTATWTAGASGSILGSDAFSVTVTAEVSDDVTGTIAQTLPKVAQAVSGTNEPLYTGTIGQTLPHVTQAAAGSFSNLTPPTGLTVTGGDHELDIEFDAVSGADSYVVEWRRTDLTAPSLETQTSAPGYLDRLDDASGTDGTYTWTWDGTGTVVYIVDSGMRYTHNEFDNITLRPGGSLGATDYDDPTEVHGTACGSIVAGDTFGVAKGASLCCFNVSDVAEWDTNDLTAAQIEDVVDFILADVAVHGLPAIASCSFGMVGMSVGGTDSAPLQVQLGRLLDAGIPVVKALGNNNEDATANIAEGDDRLIWVGNSTTGDVRASSSNWADQLAVYAPADGMTSAGHTSDSATASFGGTSGACPMVAGVAAKILGANPELSVARLREVIVSQGRPVITSVPGGPNLLLDSFSQTTEWSRHPTASTTLTLDGLDNSAEYEIRVVTVDGGDESSPSSAQSAETMTPVTGTVAQTLPHVTQSASGTAEAEFTGTVAQTLPHVTQAAAGTNEPEFTGTVTQTLPHVTQAASGTAEAEYTGAIAQTLPHVTQAASGTNEPEYEGTAAQTLPIVGQAAAGTFTLPAGSGTMAQTLPAVTQAAAGTAEAEYEGTMAQTLPRVTQSVTGTAEAEFVGAIIQTLPMITQSGAGTHSAPGNVTGAAAQTLGRVGQAIAGEVDNPPGTVGIITQTLPVITQSGAGTYAAPNRTGTITQALPRLTQTGAGTAAPPVITGTITQTLPHVTQIMREFAPWPDIAEATATLRATTLWRADLT